jgi:pyrroline-5-carboxylate reductase
MKIALIGPGKLGTAVAARLPRNAEKIIIGRGEHNARRLAEKMDWPYALELSQCHDADAILLTLDAQDINPVLAQAAAFAKKGALILNMATKGVVEPALLAANPRLTIVDAKVIGSAIGLQRGMPGIVVVKTGDQAVFDKIRYILCGFDQVVQGDADMVPKINSIGSGEGIRAAVMIQKKLEGLGVPKEWEKMLLRSVAPGTMQAFAEDRLGHFAQELADKVRKELNLDAGERQA